MQTMELEQKTDKPSDVRQVDHEKIVNELSHKLDGRDTELRQRDAELRQRDAELRQKVDELDAN
eukprot:gene9190-18344_t